MVKIWGSSKNDQNQIMRKSLKVYFYNSSFLVLVVVVVLFQFQLEYLKNQTELRDETL